MTNPYFISAIFQTCFFSPFEIKYTFVEIIVETKYGFLKLVVIFFTRCRYVIQASINNVHIVRLTIWHHLFLDFWLVNTSFFAYWRHQRAVTRLKNVRQLNTRRGKSWVSNCYIDNLYDNTPHGILKILPIMWWVIPKRSLTRF